jgi:hypothetical protein
LWCADRLHEVVEETQMQGSHDQFFVQYGGEIRESLIMIEGDDGSFELLAHGVEYALVLTGRSGATTGASNCSHMVGSTAKMEMTAFPSLWSEAAIPIVCTFWSRRPLAIPATYTTGIGSSRR